MSANTGMYADFYANIGLDLSRLETGFADASMTIEQNIRRLNHESNLIRLRSEVEIAGLDEVADAERIVQIRTNALNQQMTIQRDRARLLEAELQHLTQTLGAESSEAQRTATRLERTRLSLANMERELRNLNNTQSESNNIFGELRNMLPSMPNKFQAAAAGIGAITAASGMAAKSVEELLNNFRELQQQAYELNMPIGRTRDFLRQLRLGGGDIGDFEGYIRGITDAFVKGEADDPEFIALRKYGAVITDTTGRLKDFKDIADEVYQAFKKADEAGEGIEFLQLTGGESGIRDAIQFFKRYEEAVADAQKIVQSNIDETQLHELDRAMKLVEEQATELKNALGDIFVPAAQSAAESFFETLREGTKYLTENKDAIQSLGFIAKETFQTVSSEVQQALATAGKKISEVNETAKGKTGDARVDKVLGDMSWRYVDLTKAYGVDAMISGQVNETAKSFGIMDSIIERAKQKQAEYNAELKKTAEQIAANDRELDRNPLNQYALQRVQQFKDELADLRVDLDFEDEFEKARARLDIWFEQEFTRKNYLSEAEEKIIRELYDAKLEKINADYQAELEAAEEQVQEHFRNAADIEYEMTHTAYEKQLRDIEQWRDAKIKAGEDAAAIIAESAAKEAEAFEREVDRIKDLTQSFEDEIFEMEHSRYESDIRRALQKAQKGYDEGVAPDIISYWLSKKRAMFDTRAAESRTSGGDYTNTPNGGMQRGGNGIMVIEGDQIIDDGLIRGQQQEISLMADENRIRAQVMQSMTAEQRARIEEIQARQESANAQRQLTQAVQQAASGFQIIEGDTLVTQFGNTIQQTRAELEQSNPFQSLTDTQALLTESTQGLTDAQKSLHTAMNDLPPEYFRNLADSAKSVSEMQFALTESTMKLIDAQDALKNALSNLPTGQSSDREVAARSDRYLSLATSTMEVADAQDLLARTTREANGRLSQISDIPPQRRDTQRDSGWKLGFDYDTAKDIMLTGVGLAAASATTGIGIAVSPEILAGSAAAALGGGFIKGSYDATTATPQENLSGVNVDLSALQTGLENIDTSVQGIRDDIKAYSSEKQPELQEIPMPEWLSQPLNALDTPLSNILQELQNAKVENAEIEGDETYENVNLQELFGTLPNIEMGVQNILQEMQTQGTHETTLSFETIVTPLEHIAGIGQDILSALSTLKDSMGRQQPPQITVSPNQNINLGGAYVFDNEMKKALVDDITNRIVDAITQAVSQATNQNFSYGS